VVKIDKFAVFLMLCGQECNEGLASCWPSITNFSGLST